MDQSRNNFVFYGEDMTGKASFDFVKPPSHKDYLMALEHWKEPVQIPSNRGGRNLPQVKIKHRGLD